MPRSEARINSRSETETIGIGRAIGRAIQNGDVVLLRGELGAGKTRLVEGMTQGIGAPGETRSPTFVLVNEYEGRVKLAHCDLYRLGGPEDTGELGLEDYLTDSAVAVEWAERAPSLFPGDALTVAIEFGEGVEERTIIVAAGGDRSARLLDEIRNALSSGFGSVDDAEGAARE